MNLLAHLPAHVVYATVLAYVNAHTLGVDIQQPMAYIQGILQRIWSAGPFLIHAFADVDTQRDFATTYDPARPPQPTQDNPAFTFRTTPMVLNEVLPPEFFQRANTLQQQALRRPAPAPTAESIPKRTRKY
jgi:hypothetical protein